MARLYRLRDEFDPGDPEEWWTIAESEARALELGRSYAPSCRVLRDDTDQAATMGASLPALLDSGREGEACILNGEFRWMEDLR